jgi:hypothetical protein
MLGIKSEKKREKGLDFELFFAVREILQSLSDKGKCLFVRSADKSLQLRLLIPYLPITSKILGNACKGIFLILRS